MDRDVASTAVLLVLGDETRALHEHAAGTASRVEYAALKRLEDLDHQANDWLRRVKFTAALALGHGELAEEILADASQLFRELRYLDVPLVGVADGVDTSGKEAKVIFTVKSLLSDMYLDKLSDKTRRGLEGRALAGFSTGGLPLGYRSSPQCDEHERIVGHRIEIDEDGAATIRRIFDEYLKGNSYAAIAQTAPSRV